MLLELQQAPITLTDAVSDAPEGTKRPRNAHKDAVVDAPEATQRALL